MIHMWSELNRRSPALTALVAIHLVMLVVLTCAILIDATQILGISRWVKPAKFAVSIAIYLTTIAWLLPAAALPERTQRRLVAVIGTAMTLEMIGILVQAARGTTSHFNIATPFDAAVFNLMGMLIMLNSVAVAWIGVGALRVLRRDPSGYQSGVVVGIAVFLLGSAIGGWIVSNNAHTIGAPDGGPGLPFVNWSTVAGDLRIAHFVGLHALQGLPLVGAWFGRRAVYAAAIAWVLITVALSALAAMGRPLYWV